MAVLFAEYIDRYGDTRRIRKSKNGVLQVQRQRSTVPITLTNIVGPMVGQRIRDARQKAGYSLAELCMRAGIVSATPKQRMYEIEIGVRTEGIRFGTLYALAIALNVSPASLMPTVEEVMAKAETVQTLTDMLPKLTVVEKGA